MKLYLITTGAVFGLLTLAHIARLFAEGWSLAREPYFVFITLAGAALAVWAWWLVKPSSRSRGLWGGPATAASVAVLYG